MNDRDAKSYSIIASVYERMELDKQAINDLDRAIMLNSSESEYYKQRGDIFVELGFLDKALKDMDASVKHAKNPARYMIDKADICMRMGKNDEALATLSAAITKKDQYSSQDALEKRIEFYKKQKRYDLALLDCNTWIESDRDNDFAYETRADIYELVNQDDKAEFDIVCAIKIMDEELKKNREDKYSYKKRGNYKFRLGRVAQAQEDWKKALNLYLNGDSPDEYEFDSIISLARKIDDHAFLKTVCENYLDNLDNQIKFDKKNPQLYVKRAKVYERLDEPVKAKEDWSRALKCMSKAKMDSVAYEDMLPEILKKLDRKEELAKIAFVGIERLRKKAKEFPTSAETFHDLTVELNKLEIFDEAIDAITRAIELEPENDHYLWHRARLYLKCKNFSRAADDLKAAVKLKDDDNDYHVELAKALTLSDRQEESIKEATIALSRDKSLAGAYYWRARANRASGNVAAALKDSQKAKEFKYDSSSD